MRAAIATLIAALLLPAGAYAEAPEVAPPAGQNRIAAHVVTGLVAAFDVVILRPLGLAVMAVGAAAFVPAAFLASPMGLDGWKTASEIFIVEPTKNVFQRPLGDF
jgi:hypothetical protein